MAGAHEIPKPQEKPGTQLHLNFDQVADEMTEQQAFEQERDEIAKKYKVANPTMLTKKEDVWYMGVHTVEDWHKFHEDTKHDDLEIYKG